MIAILFLVMVVGLFYTAHLQRWSRFSSLLSIAVVTLLGLGYFGQWPERYQAFRQERMVRQWSTLPPGALFARLHQTAAAHPQDLTGWLLLAKLARQMGDPHVDAYIAKAAALAPKEPRVQLLLAEQAWLTGNSQDCLASIAEMQALVEQYPDATSAWALLAQLNEKLQNKAAAKEAWQHLAAHYPPGSREYQWVIRRYVVHEPVRDCNRNAKKC